MSTWSERAEKFKQDWKDHGQSKEDALSFWHGFLGDVLKIDNPMSYIKLKSVEEANFSRFVTLSIPSTNVEIRHVLSKLGETVSFRDFDSPSPIGPALDYRMFSLPPSPKSRIFVLCNFEEFRICDMEQQSKTVNVKLSELEKSDIEDIFRLLIEVPDIKKHPDDNLDVSNCENDENKNYIFMNREISFESLYRLYESDKEFRTLVGTGQFRYIDGYVVLNSKECISYDPEKDESHLSHYARLNIVSCTLQLGQQEHLNHLSSVNNSGLSLDTKYIRYFDAYKLPQVDYSSLFKMKNSKKNNSTESNFDNIKKYYEVYRTIIENGTATFGNVLSAVMVTSKTTNEKLAEKIGVDDKTISRYRNDGVDNIPLENIIKICLVLALPPLLSRILIERSSHTLSTSEKHLHYSLLLELFSGASTDECNQFLEGIGKKPLFT